MVDSHGAHKHRKRRTHSKKKLREKKRQQFIRLYGLQACLVLLLVTLIPAWYFMSRGFTEPPPPPSEVLQSGLHLSDMKKLLQQVRLDGQLDKPHPFDFRLTATDLEVGLTGEGEALDSLRAKAIEVKAVKLSNGRIEVTATAPGIGAKTGSNVSLVPAIDNGSLSFPPAADAGTKSSSPAETSFALDLGTALERLVSVGTVKYRSAKVEEGSLVLSGNSAERRY